MKCVDRRWGPPCVLFSGYRRSFPGVMRPECDIDHSYRSSPEDNNECSHVTAPPPIPIYVILTYTGTTLPLYNVFRMPCSSLTIQQIAHVTMNIDFVILLVHVSALIGHLQGGNLERNKLDNKWRPRCVYEVKIQCCQ